MENVEQDIKNQFSKIFEFKDTPVFKKMADYYFEQAAKLLNKDIDIEDKFKLMVRNIQKRLFIGIATELLLKSIYLKNGYCINKHKKGFGIGYPDLFKNINKVELEISNTYSLNELIDNFSKISKIHLSKDTIKGLKICKVFRNKEGHIAVLHHKAIPQNYRDIESAIIDMYNIGFGEKLKFKISFMDEEESLFNIENKKPNR